MGQSADIMQVDNNGQQRTLESELSNFRHLFESDLNNMSDTREQQELRAALSLFGEALESDLSNFRDRDEQLAFHNALTNLTDSTTQQKDIPPDTEATDETRGLECKICTINKICVVLSKCGHTFCYSCTTRFRGQCATCRTEFTDETRIRMYI